MTGSQFNPYGFLRMCNGEKCTIVGGISWCSRGTSTIIVPGSCNIISDPRQRGPRYSSDPTCHSGCSGSQEVQGSWSICWCGGLCSHSACQACYMLPLSAHSRRTSQNLGRGFTMCGRPNSIYGSGPSTPLPQVQEGSHSTAGFSGPPPGVIWCLVYPF